MKIKSIKYNKNGLTRAENANAKFVMPKKDLDKDNIIITTNKHYLQVLPKKTAPNIGIANSGAGRKNNQQQ